MDQRSDEESERCRSVSNDDVSTNKLFSSRSTCRLQNEYSGNVIQSILSVNQVAHLLDDQIFNPSQDGNPLKNYKTPKFNYFIEEDQLGKAKTSSNFKENAPVLSERHVKKNLKFKKYSESDKSEEEEDIHKIDFYVPKPEKTKGGYWRKSEINYKHLDQFDIDHVARLGKTRYSKQS